VPAAIALSAAFVVGSAGAVQAQDDAAEGIDGTWSVDTSIGTFDDFSSSWAGFRVWEVLDTVGDFEAVGRTPGVTGQLSASGATIEDVVVEVDLTGLVTDNAFRDQAIQRTLDTNQFPTATFVSTESVELGSVPADGEPFAASVPGTITVREVTQDVVVELQGQRAGDVVVVVGTLPVDFTSFDVTMPTAPIVASVEDSGDLEWQLFLTRDAEMADEDMADEDMADDEDMAEEEAAEE
jgi:polyisoprenoid-binding protein YceI